MQWHGAYPKGWESPNWVKVALWFSLYPQAGLIISAQRTDGFWNLHAKRNFRDNPETKGMLTGRPLCMHNLFILTHLQRWLIFFSVVRFNTLSGLMSWMSFKYDRSWSSSQSFSSEILLLFLSFSVPFCSSFADVELTCFSPLINPTNSAPSSSCNFVGNVTLASVNMN